jgi:hypothetical protein
MLCHTLGIDIILTKLVFAWLLRKATSLATTVDFKNFLLLCRLSESSASLSEAFHDGAQAATSSQFSAPNTMRHILVTNMPNMPNMPNIL